MNLNYGPEYKNFKKEVITFCKKWEGVHFVDEGVDTGQLIVQKKFSRFKKDSLQDFKERGQRLEHKAYIEAIFKVQKGDYR